jgi:hypothetical protein
MDPQDCVGKDVEILYPHGEGEMFLLFYKFVLSNANTRYPLRS